MNQDQLAAAMGISRGTVVLCESGKSCPDLAAMERARQVGLDSWFVQTGTRHTISEEQWRDLRDIAIGVEAFLKTEADPERTAPKILKLIEMVARARPVTLTPVQDLGDKEAA